MSIASVGPGGMNVNGTLTSANINALQGQANTASTNVSTLQGQMGTANGNISTLQGQIGTANGNISSLQSQMAGANGNISSLQQQMGAANSNISTLQGQMGTANTNISSLGGQISAANGEHFQLLAFAHNINGSFGTNGFFNFGLFQGAGISYSGGYPVVLRGGSSQAQISVNFPEGIQLNLLQRSGDHPWPSGNRDEPAWSCGHISV